VHSEFTVALPLPANSEAPTVHSVGLDSFRRNNITDNLDTYRIYTDGSASTHGPKAGGYAAIILKNGEFEKIVTGGWANTTIGKMEMHAIIAALEYIRKLPGAMQAEVQVYCDRQDVVFSAIGQYARRSNRDEWRRFDHAGKGLNLTVEHIPRNSNEFSSQCDDLSGQIRLSVEKDPTRVFDSEKPKHE
jgi:ribonuclease HI